ncbi:MAG TPA: energy transducer TonB [Gemmatimonadaceae bacterium]|nr:energy transducer TonB [Gemmatimonadaceae bacterium]
MMAQLVESSPRPARRRVSSLVSVVVHGIVLTAAAAAARPLPPPPAATDVVIPVYPPKPPQPTRCRGCGPSRSGTGDRESRVRLPGPITTKIDVEVDEPDVVLDHAEVGRDEWGTGADDGPSRRPTEAPGAGSVDREVVPWPTNPVPRYPAELRAVRLQGSVSARFVVDTTGRVIMESVRVDAATHERFADAVMDALRRCRFTPAELRGRKVNQLVSQSFVFVLRD